MPVRPCTPIKVILVAATMVALTLVWRSPSVAQHRPLVADDGSVDEVRAGGADHRARQKVFPGWRRRAAEQFHGTRGHRRNDARKVVAEAKEGARSTVLTATDAVAPRQSKPERLCRVVALGDVHGDLNGMRRALRAAKIIDANNVWSGGCATLVQTGDVVDRGQESIKCLDELEKWKQQAPEDGGRVVTLLGNHELLNIQGHTHYASPFEVEQVGGTDAWLNYFRPSGKFWKRFLDSPIVAIINGSAFVHGGLLPTHVTGGVAHLNAFAQSEIAKGRFSAGVFGEAGPLWTREVIIEARRGVCDDLERTLSTIGAIRLVIGHTPQVDGKIHEYCGGKLIAIDTGLSREMMNHPSALEILPDGTTHPIYPVD
jgi:hypothetical protein